MPIFHYGPKLTDVVCGVRNMRDGPPMSRDRVMDMVYVAVGSTLLFPLSKIGDVVTYNICKEWNVLKALGAYAYVDIIHIAC